MRSSTAPAGYITEVEVIVRIRDRGQTHEFTYAWTSPMGLSQAYGKAPGWAKEELRKQRIRGRSHIVGWAIEVRYRLGTYRRS